jgi:hypothetical protein
MFGRVGQALLALFSWHAFSIHTTVSMGTSPTTYQFYRTIFLESSPSFRSTIGLISNPTSLKSIRSKTAMAFMVATMIFILAFPTLAGAMTGYTSVVKAYIPDISDANMIRFDSFDAIIYVIHDGKRIKIQDNQIVTVVRKQSEDLGSSNVSDCSFVLLSR